VFHPEKLGIKNADYWGNHTSEDNLAAEKAEEAQQSQR
jgi:AGCS family alanine or glycine:cation symporter